MGPIRRASQNRISRIESKKVLQTVSETANAQLVHSATKVRKLEFEHSALFETTINRRLRNETAKKAVLGGWSTTEFDSVSSGDEHEEEPKKKGSQENESVAKRAEQKKQKKVLSKISMSVKRNSFEEKQMMMWAEKE